MPIGSSGTSMGRNSWLLVFIILIAPITGFFVFHLKGLKQLLIFLMIWRYILLILSGICLDLIIFLTVMSVHFLHFNSIKIFLSTVIMFDLTFPAVIFITINFIRVGLCKIWIQVVIILPHFIICVVLMNFFVSRLLINFRLSLVLLLLLCLSLSLFLLVVDFLPLLVSVRLYSIRCCVVVVLRYLLWFVNPIIVRLRFILNIFMTFRCCLFIYNIIIFLHLRRSFIFGETSIEELYLGKIIRIWTLTWNVLHL